MGCKSVLLHEEGFSHLVCVDELYRDQHRLHPEEAYTHPDVHRLAIGVREHTLGNTDLPTHRIVDLVTSAVVGCRRSCPAHVVLRVYCCFGISYSFRAGQMEGRLVVLKRAASPARFGGSSRPAGQRPVPQGSQALCE